MKLDVLCVSDMCVDLIIRGNVRPRFGQVEQLVDGYTLECGGSANIFASQFAKLGGRPGVIGRVGADTLGRLALDRLAGSGVNVSRVRVQRGLQTGLGVALVEPGDRAILTCPGSIDSVGPRDLSSGLLRACRHWHIASYFLLNRLRRAWPGWLRRLRAQGVTVSLDTNWDPQETWAGVRELLPLVDVFLPNEQEALALSGRRSVLAAGRALAALGPLVVIKCGGRGALAFSGDSCCRAVVSRRLRAGLRIVDSIGAGDSFDAGFVRAWQLGLPLCDCLGWGVRCGCASLRAAGGFESQLRETIRG